MLTRLARLMVTSVFIVSFMGINPSYAGKSSYLSIGFIGDDKVAHVTINDNNIITVKSDDSDVSPLERTKQIAKNLNQLLYDRKLRPDRILPGIRGKKYIARIDDQVIFTIDDRLAKTENTNPSQLTMKWVNNLRHALGGHPVDYHASRGLAAFSGQSQYGYASWYGGNFNGRYTSSGEIYNMYKYTAAHRTLPLGTPVLVTNLDTGRSVLVKINDRGPFADTGNRIIDLSSSAFRAIAPLNAGVIRIRIDVMS
jgi:hypothetical protein